jgi:hypothetical protein
MSTANAITCAILCAFRLNMMVRVEWNQSFLKRFSNKIMCSLEQSVFNLCQLIVMNYVYFYINLYNPRKMNFY